MRHSLTVRNTRIASEARYYCSWRGGDGSLGGHQDASPHRTFPCRILLQTTLYKAHRGLSGFHTRYGYTVSTQAPVLPGGFHRPSGGDDVAGDGETIRNERGGQGPIASTVPAGRAWRIISHISTRQFTAPDPPGFFSRSAALPGIPPLAKTLREGGQPNGGFQQPTASASGSTGALVSQIPTSESRI